MTDKSTPVDEKSALAAVSGDSKADEAASGEKAEMEPPQSAKPKKPRKNYEIDIFKAWCKSCGICAAFCPKQCIKIEEDGAPAVEAPEQCSGCGWCEIHCPDFAISVRQVDPKKAVGLD